MAANIWVNGESVVECVSQWTLKVFPHSQISETDNIAELSTSSEQNPQRIHRIGTVGRHCVAIPDRWVLWQFGSWVWLLPWCPPLPPDTVKRNGKQKYGIA